MISSFFRASADGYWPHHSIVEQLQASFDEVVLDTQNSEENQKFYRVTLHGLTFLAVLIHVDGHEDKIIGFGFLTIFVGFEVSDTGLEALNRNLHLSVAEFDTDRNLLLFAFLEPKGAFDANRFSLILQAWKRDIVMTVKMIAPGASLAGALSGAFSGKGLSQALSLALNMANTNPEVKTNPEILRGDTVAGMAINMAGERSQKHEARQPEPTLDNTRPREAAMRSCTQAQSLIANLLGLQDASRQICATCDGRGMTGFPRRSCKSCSGSGLTAPTL